MLQKFCVAHTKAIDPMTSETKYYGHSVVREFHDADFKDDLLGIALVRDTDPCSVILFYNGTSDDAISKIKIFTAAAQEAIGVTFGVVDARQENRIAASFVKIKGEGTHPYHWMNITGYPVVIGYRRGLPIGVYKKAFTKEDLLSYAMKQACTGGTYDETPVPEPRPAVPSGADDTHMVPVRTPPVPSRTPAAGRGYRGIPPGYAPAKSSDKG